jgi:hypothetical protein
MPLGIHKKAAIVALNIGLTVPYKFIPKQCLKRMTDEQKHAALNANISPQYYQLYNLLPTMRRTKQRVPSEILGKWNDYFRKGDGQLMSAEIGCSPQLIAIAMKQGLATPELMVKISEFYAKRVAENATPNELIEKAKALLQ